MNKKIFFGIIVSLLCINMVSMAFALKGKNLIMNTQTCNSDLDCPKYYEEDFCYHNKFLFHGIHNFSCKNHLCVEDEINQPKEICNQKCINNTCIKSQCLENADCGRDYSVDSCMSKDVITLFHQFRCVNNFCNEYISFNLKERCAQECLNGTCIFDPDVFPNSDYELCSNKSPKASRCKQNEIFCVNLQTFTEFCKPLCLNDEKGFCKV
ncbi:MAG: hypothetical protein ACOYT4_04780 [Nanoarchaeota archaeon]